MSDDNKATPTTKVIAVAAVSIAGLLGYSLFADAQAENCHQKAIVFASHGIFEIADTRWRPRGCQYLSRYRLVGSTYSWHDEWMLVPVEERAKP